ncbi:uncharacterized protein PAC_03986 [Phialocephala subalpina]|uniref:Uncharacterized protein n=1 Tax=Phialocephala subalpina TaxID=576137 RepID=A0A1L7WMU9_9HELO|nr:uncharacterized protein PAC_03986 [Phialocephala subalpina]
MRRSRKKPPEEDQSLTSRPQAAQKHPLHRPRWLDHTTALLFLFITPVRAPAAPAACRATLAPIRCNFERSFRRDIAVVTTSDLLSDPVKTCDVSSTTPTQGEKMPANELKKNPASNRGDDPPSNHEESATGAYLRQFMANAIAATSVEVPVPSKHVAGAAYKNSDARMAAAQHRERKTYHEWYFD